MLFIPDAEGDSVIVLHHLFGEISNIRVAEDEREQVEERGSNASAFLLRYVNLVAIRQHSRCDSARTREFAGKLTSYIHTKHTTHTYIRIGCSYNARGISSKDTYFIFLRLATESLLAPRI